MAKLDHLRIQDFGFCMMGNLTILLFLLQFLNYAFPKRFVGGSKFYSRCWYTHTLCKVTSWSMVWVEYSHCTLSWYLNTILLSACSEN